MALQMADDAVMDALEAGRNAKKLLAVFFMNTCEAPEESIEAGHKVFREEEWIKIQVPGNTLDVVTRPVRPSDIENYPEQYRAFKARVEQPVNGIPLEKIPFLTASRVMEFKSIGVNTAEQLRDMSDALAQKFMDGHAIRKRVGQFIEAVQHEAPFEKFKADLSERDAKIEQLMQALEAQGEKIEQLTKNQRRG